MSATVRRMRGCMLIAEEDFRADLDYCIARAGDERVAVDIVRDDGGAPVTLVPSDWYDYLVRTAAAAETASEGSDT